MSNTNHPILSVIIPTLNSPLIADTVAALRRQKVASSQIEIIVVGLDEQRKIRDDDGVRFISSEKPASAASNRNRGIAAASGQILCFTDADCLPSETWLQRITAHFARDEVMVVGGGVDFEASSYWARCDHLSWFCNFLINRKSVV